MTERIGPQLHQQLTRPLHRHQDGCPRLVSVVGRINPWVRDGSSGGSEDSRDRWETANPIRSVIS